MVNFNISMLFYISLLCSPCGFFDMGVITELLQGERKKSIVIDDHIEKKMDPILLICNKHSNTLSFVNPKTFEVIQTIPTGPNPHEIAVTPDQSTAYLSSYAPPGNTISVVDLKKRQLVKEISTGKYGRIHGVAISPDGEFAYFTAGQSGFIIEISTRTNEITRTFPTHGEISHMVYISDSGKLIFTGNVGSGNVSVIDRISGDLVTIIETGQGAGGMAFGPDGNSLWVTNETDETISIIDLSTLEVIENFQCKGTIKRIRFTDDGRMALLTAWNNPGEVIILDVDTKAEVKRIEVGDNAIGIEFSPDGKYAFIGCEDALGSKMLSDGSELIGSHKIDSDGVHVLDMEKLEVVSRIKTGLGPDPMIMWYPSKLK